MARPIESTPILTGKDAERFLASIQDPKPYKAPVFDFEKMSLAIKKIAERDETK